MFLKRVTLPFACFLLVVAWAGPAPAKTYRLGINSGAEVQIGGGLPLPIQLTDANLDLVPDWGAVPTTGISPLPLQPAPATTGVGAGVFPPLLIPAKANATVMDTAPGGSLTIPAGVLSRPAVQLTLGVNAQNPALYAVATNLGYKWPAASAMLGKRLTTMKAGGGFTTALPLNAVTVYKATTGGGGKIKYRNPGKTAVGFFGGPARLVITPMLGPPPGPALPAVCPGAAVCGPLKTTVAVSVFAIGANAPPPCAGAACNALLLKAAPVGSQAVGGPPFVPVATVGMGVAGKNVFNIVAGSAPKGTISAVLAGVATAALPGNTALSAGFPWTTGRITVSHPAAAGSPERFVLSGSDMRTVGGAGAIQLVSGAVSIRPPPVAGGSGPNANRGWVRLELVSLPPTAVPSISDLGLVVLSGSLLVMGLFVMLRRSRGVEAGA